MAKKPEELQQVLHYTFKNPALLRIAFGTSLELDEAEARYFAQTLELGYGPQPPLYFWLLGAAYALVRDASGMYRSGQEELPGSSRWNVVLEDPDRSWRLVGVTTGFNQPLEFAVQRR